MGAVANLFSMSLKIGKPFEIKSQKLNGSRTKKNLDPMSVARRSLAQSYIDMFAEKCWYSQDVLLQSARRAGKPPLWMLAKYGVTL